MEKKAYILLDFINKKNKFTFQNELDLINSINCGKITLEEAAEIQRKMKNITKILENITFPSAPCKDGYFYIKLSNPHQKGKRKTLKAKTITALREKAYEYILQVQICKPTFKELFNLAEQNRIDITQDVEKSVSVKHTNSKHLSRYNKFIAGTDFEMMPINKITVCDITALVENNIKSGKLKKKKALSEFIAILNEVYKYAFTHDDILNPYDSVLDKMDWEVYRNSLEDITPPSQRAFSDLQIKQILEEINKKHEKNPDYMPAYALELIIMTGLRRGEVPVLKRSDIEYLEQYNAYILNVTREQLVSHEPSNKPGKKYKEVYIEVNHTKTHKDRSIPITGDMKAFIDHVLTICDTYYPDSEYLFPARNDIGCLTVNMVYNYFRRILQRLNIPMSHDLTKGTHAFRRTVGTDLLNNSNGNIELVADILGNSPDVIRKNYKINTNIEKGLAVFGQSKYCHAVTSRDLEVLKYA